MSSLVSIRTDDDLLGQFTSLAEATGRSRSFLINQAMREFIEREAWQISRKPLKKLMPVILPVKKK